ncbi:glycosyltransferase [Tenacibaculum finnmarkense]|uniref:glycosyltransferase n=1 Tax=Tenacibaculum finnmarkense TaxID=2781243 RepID=UPI00187BBA88|nr:glycosyltransferase [Tenacibaculum finnmarkense]MBE7646447.1 glycosyltransferase [Tenacibaculum finnmarkense genomovar ulcerans]MBE7660884.1 glycosyltransferase [Tenacibaculum finnmarkense genomovar finnmarkense]MCG8252526.1 glycosyltransferase [Tenacibaculum finnmarkense genomovar finnmarkense]MCG8808341.1 glycosyltransferase family 4 protein [Tenacibaculum finnmarkense]MCG8815954.1 glycosyltransferase family 4 protein [Tenacibaculum finnmarkense]
MNKKVLYIGGFELPDKNAAAQRVIANAKILHEICEEVVLAGVGKDQGQVEFLSEPQSFDGILYYNVKYPKGYKAWLHYITTIEYIIKLIDKHAITHVIAYNYPGFALYRLHNICKKKGVKLLSDCTEWYEATGSPIRRIIKKIDVSLRMNTVQPKLDGLMVISDFLFDFYKDKVDNIINVPPLVDLSMKKWDIEVVANKENAINLIYAGSPGAGQKDRLDLIIEALQRILKDTNLKIIFTVIGITKEQYKANFNIKDDCFTAIDSFVNFKGRLTHLEVLSQVKVSDYQVFVRDENLTTSAGFPTKYVEAISCGTPVLTNSAGSIVNFYEQGKTGFLLDNSSLDNLVISFKEILTKEIDIQSMKAYCKNSKMFDISNFKNQFIKFLEKA